MADKPYWVRVLWWTELDADSEQQALQVGKDILTGMLEEGTVQFSVTEIYRA